MFEPIGHAASRVVDDLERKRRLGSAARGRIAKEHLRLAMRLGTGHLWVRSRYGARARMVRNHTIDAAIFLVEHHLREEKRTFEILRVFGKEVALSLQVLTEVLIILRMLRRSNFRNHLPGVIDFVLGAQFGAVQ